MPIASYLESGILSWGVPLGLLVVIGIYWAIVARRHPEDF
jgi:cytochrome c-type biogenesis protein CcmH/NrfF